MVLGTPGAATRRTRQSTTTATATRSIGRHGRNTKARKALDKRRCHRGHGRCGCLESHEGCRGCRPGAGRRGIVRAATGAGAVQRRPGRGSVPGDCRQQDGFAGNVGRVLSPRFCQQRPGADRGTNPDPAQHTGRPHQRPDRQGRLGAAANGTGRPKPLVPDHCDGIAEPMARGSGDREPATGGKRGESQTQVHHPDKGTTADLYHFFERGRQVSGSVPEIPDETFSGFVRVFRHAGAVGCQEQFQGQKPVQR
mmetsp:Transcript_15187/g.32647  ORF Transcript_15187/g.32647 Transcript_15187/m.32647 type:complete len:253 (+) Transcript_15187:1441-2199(+)